MDKTLDKLKNIDDLLEESQKNKQLPASKNQNLKHQNKAHFNYNYLEFKYLKSLLFLKGHKSKTLKITRSHRTAIKTYNLLVKLHLVKVSKIQHEVTYRLTSIGELLINKKHPHYVLRVIFGLIICFLSDYLAVFSASVLLAPIPFLIGFLSSVLLMSAGVLIILFSGFSYDESFNERRVLGLLSHVLDAHEFSVALRIFRSHEKKG